MYMGVKLSKLPEAMGLTDLDNLKKGDFPFILNTYDMLDYNGKWPVIDLYDADSRLEEQ